MNVVTKPPVHKQENVSLCLLNEAEAAAVADWQSLLAPLSLLPFAPVPTRRS